MLCFNKKVVGGLAAVALGTLVVAPHLLGRVVPLLFVLACPLSMVLMMRAMSGGQARCSMGDSKKAATDEPQTTGRPVEAEVRELREEINRLRAEAALRDVTPPSDAPDARRSTR